MFKVLASTFAAAALLTVSGCGDRKKAAEPAVEAPVEAPVLRGSIETDPQPVTPAGPQVPEISGETTRFALRPDRWKVRDGEMSEIDAGLAVTLEETGNVFAQTGNPVSAGDEYVAQIDLEAAGDQKMRARIVRGCDRTAVEQTVENVRLTDGENSVTVRHIFAEAHACARLQLDALQGPSDLIVTKATLTKLD